MRHLAARLSWKQAAILAKADAVALLPVGSTEAHGPHLPLSVDVVIAEEVCRRIGLQLEGLVDVVQFPSVAYSLTEFAVPFSGTVTVGAEAARAYLAQVLLGLAKGGFSRIAVINHHLEPAHFKLVHEASMQAAAQCSARIVVPDHRRQPTGPLLGEEFMHGGSHAGCYETSLMLAAAPQLVDDTQRLQLPSLAVDLPALIRGGAKDFLSCGGPEAYFGDPAAATEAEGNRLFELIASASAAAIREILE